MVDVDDVDAVVTDDACLLRGFTVAIVLVPDTTASVLRQPLLAVIDIITVPTAVVRLVYETKNVYVQLT